MYRNELNVNDNEIIALLNDHWNFSVKKIHYVDIGGGSFGFICIINDNTKYFLKIYKKSLYPEISLESLNQIGTSLYRFRNEFNVTGIPCCILSKNQHYAIAYKDLQFVVYEYVEGYHPTYEPNQLHPEKLARILFQLYRVPTEEFFLDLDLESFESEYALGIKKYLNYNDTEERASKMLAHLKSHQKIILQHLSFLEKSFLDLSMTRIGITHGDPHHYNVLQNEKELWLVDWDGIKIAPVERDLWHYANSPLIAEYQKLSPEFHLNHKLCRFYQLERFLSDLRYYLEQVLLQKTVTQEQAEQDCESFLRHWGWQICDISL